MPLVHHELCFGCGRTNLFGLLTEVEPTRDGGVAGRCFLKQDHQGPEPGVGHDGVIAAALTEAMSLAAGPQARARAASLEVSYEAGAPVGAFVEITAGLDADGAARASARSEGRLVARARTTFR